MIMRTQLGCSSKKVLIRSSSSPPSVACSVQKLTAAEASSVIVYDNLKIPQNIIENSSRGNI
jgi:hypothetical protein